MKVIESWLSTMNEEGWICREQSRGAEAVGLCSCTDFLKKDNRDGNPPSLLLAVAALIEQEKNSPRLIDFLKCNFARLERWLDWYLQTQKIGFKEGPDAESSIIMRYWDASPEIFSMNSGLDDYPRNNKQNIHYF